MPEYSLLFYKRENSGIMRPEEIFAEKLEKLFKVKKVTSMSEMMEILGTKVEKTVYRKLKELSYRSSYSHRGKFYTLNTFVEFDHQGLWSYRSIWFSKFGTLLNTSNSFVEDSKMGYSAKELKNILRVETKESLFHLFKKKKLDRVKIAGNFIYISRKTIAGRSQLKKRREYEENREIGIVPSSSDVLAHELKAAILLYFSLLDEKQKRHYAGIESARLGYGGDKIIAKLLKIDPHTVAKGREEVFERGISIMNDGIRKSGGGRKSKKKAQKQ
jgi:hypothetical protein